jgi:hypothetical protein
MNDLHTITMAMGSDRSGSRTPDVGLPPAALARHADDERRRELARALHGPPAPRARRISEQLDILRGALAGYRERAIALHARLVELEASGNDNVTPIRQALIDSSVRIEAGARALLETPDPAIKRPA